MKHEFVTDAAVTDYDDRQGSKYLCAFYCADMDVDTAELKDFLRHSMKEHMVPANFIRLESIPRTASGIIDRKTLKSLNTGLFSSDAEYVAPRDEKEQAIAEVWKSVLKLEKVGIYDNFFDLGGDSIISLQVVSKLNQMGYMLHPKDILQHQNIAMLANVMEKAQGVSAEQSAVVGTAPLTPIQKWFFELGLENVHQFNQSMMFKSTIKLDEKAMEKSLQALIDHHDALRINFNKGVQEFMPLGASGHFVFKNIADSKELDAEVRKLQASFNIHFGPLIGLGVFRMDEADYLVIAGHHLVVDGISWRALLDDLLHSYMAAQRGVEPKLPDKTTSFRAWAQRLEEYAKTVDLSEEARWWDNWIASGAEQIPVDHDLGENTVESCETVSIELGEEQTRALLREAHKAYNTEINDLLITAFMRTINEWTGNCRFAIDMEGHGREAVIDDVDITRTVGWFTSVYPVMLDSDETQLPEQIKYVKERLHTIPHKGFNYNVMKYLQNLKNLSINTQLSFNYLGQIVFPGLKGIFELVLEDVPGVIAPENKRHNLIDVVCYATATTSTKINLIYSTNKHKKETIERLAASFRDELANVVAHCLMPDNFDITPSDFELAGLSQDELNRLADFE